MPVVLSHRSVSLQVCVDLSLIHRAALSRSRSELTTVKALTSWSTLSHPEARERVLPIPLSVPLTQVTLHVVLLTFLRTLSFVKRTAELQKVSRYSRSRTATRSLSRSTSVLLEDSLLRISATRQASLSYHAISSSMMQTLRRSLTQVLRGSRYVQSSPVSQEQVYVLSATVQTLHSTISFQSVKLLVLSLLSLSVSRVHSLP